MVPIIKTVAKSIKCSCQKVTKDANKTDSSCSSESTMIHSEMTNFRVKQSCKWRSGKNQTIFAEKQYILDLGPGHMKSEVEGSPHWTFWKHRGQNRHDLVP